MYLIMRGCFNSGDIDDFTSYSNASYSEVNRETGCRSKYSDDKKENIFDSDYKDHRMEWSGKVISVSSKNVSLDINGNGKKDLSVSALNDSAGFYNTEKGEDVLVDFVMRISGNCSFPFYGSHATLIY